MSIKVKLTSAVITFIMLVSMLIVGVFAVNQTNFKIGGNIVFKTKGIEATISKAEVSTGMTIDKTMEEITITPDTKSDDLTTAYETWTNMAIELTTEVNTMTFSITNNKEESTQYPYMSVKVGVTSTSMTNADIQVTNNAGGDVLYLAPGATATYTVSIYVNSMTEDATVSDFEIDFDMRRMLTNPTESTVQLSHDATGNYYYVTMGSYNSTEIKWRLASFDGVNKFNATSTTPPKMYSTATTQIEGYSDLTTEEQKVYQNAYKNVTFVQETVAMTYAFDADSNDYSGSDIRTYLKNTATTADGATSFRGDLGITSSNSAYNTIYNKITGRRGGASATTATSLYDDINYNDETEEITDGTPQITDTTSDKFWLMSVKELYTLVGGGRVKDGVIASDSAYYGNFVWKQNFIDEEGVNYYLRSPDPGDSSCAYYVDVGGAYYFDGVVFGSYAVRAAFNLNF